MCERERVSCDDGGGAGKSKGGKHSLLPREEKKSDDVTFCPAYLDGNLRVHSLRVSRALFVT